MRLRRALPTLGLVIVPALVLGCFPSLGPRAAQDLACAEDRIQVEELSPRVQKVEGCGKSDIYGQLYGTGAWVSLVERASFELSCPREDLKITAFAPIQMGVSGCNAKRVYVLTEAGWLLDSGINDGATAPHAAPPAAPAAPAPEPAAPSSPTPSPATPAPPAPKDATKDTSEIM